MIKFGPSGNSIDYLQRAKHTVQVPSLLEEDNLDCFEYSFGRGVSIGRDTAQLIAKSFAEKQKEISVHAPYFINFATDEPEKLEKTYGYLLDSIQAMHWLGGKRVVFHPGSPKKAERNVAFSRLKEQFYSFLERLHSLGLNDKIILCPETMGKVNQLGNLDEIIELVNMDTFVYPCIDFGHLNAREQGSIKSIDDYKRIIESLIENCGFEKVDNMHVHFSKIQYGKMGEIKHLTFADEEFGPPFEPLMQLLRNYNLNWYVVSESDGTQSFDAMAMKNYYYSLQS